MSPTNTPSTTLGAVFGALLITGTLWMHTLATPGPVAAAPSVAVIALPLAA